MSDARRCGVWVRGSGCVSLFGHKGPHRSSYSAEIAALQSQLAARDAEVARLREHVLDAVDCLDRVMGPRRPMTLPWNDEIRLAMDALRAALAAPTSGDAVTT